jgi:outer membrane protein assembly factor BamD (BamD/ComL family)
MRNWAAHTTLILVTAVSMAGQSPLHQEAPTAKSNVSPNTREVRVVVGQAKAAAMSIKNDFQRGLVLDQIGAAEVKGGDLEAAVETANRAYPNDMATLTAIGERLADSNDLAKAQSIKPKLKGGGSSTVFAFLAQRQAGKGDIDEALRTTEQIQAPEVRSEALNWIARRQAGNGDYSAARKTLARARATYQAGRFSPDDTEMMIAEGQLSHGDMQAARKTIDSLNSAEMRSAAMISGAEELSKNADQASARVLLEEALKGVPAGPKYDFLRYLAIPLQVKLGYTERAMLSAGALSSELRMKGYTAVAVACAEAKDVACANAALEQVQLAASSEHKDNELSDFEAKLMILNITAALLDNGEFDFASRLLTSVEQNLDEASRLSIESEAQLERVFALAQQGGFDDARSLAMKMRPNSVAEVQRGTALRLIALLQTKKNSAGSVKPWALALADAEDQAYALLGIAQALLGIDDVRLPYNPIQIH